MSNKSQVFPNKFVAAHTMVADFVTPKISMLFLDRASISVNVLTGAPVGTFQLQGRTSLSPGTGAPNYPQAVGPDSEWSVIPGSQQATPAAGASIWWDISDTGATEVRVQYVSTGGAGTCDVWFAARRSG